MLLLRGGRIVDPSQGVDEVADLLIQNGVIAAKGRQIEAAAARVIDASGLVVCPGFIDLHCHLRQPGFEEKETIATGTAAAAAGGFTAVCCMANTRPPLDSAATVEYVRRTAIASGRVRVYPLGAVSKALAGRELAELAELAEAGVVAFSDDGSPVAEGGLMRSALEYSLALDRPVVQHAEDPALSRGGVMHEGAVSARLGLPGQPAEAEAVMVARDLSLAQLIGARLHVAHVSSAAAVDLIRRAKRAGVNVTAEVTPHHLTLTHDLVGGHWWSATASLPPYDTRTKVNPPLRTAADQAALLEGLLDGTIDAVATDHAPHASVDKDCEYIAAAFGISGLETALGSLLSLVGSGRLNLVTLIAKLSTEPARVFGLPGGTLQEGAPADVTVFDPDREWVVDPGRFFSKGKNTPLAGVFLRGQVATTIVGGEVVYQWT